MLLQFLIVMAIAGAVFWFVLWPLRGPADGIAPAIDPRLLADRDRAQLAKDRKLDEIRELRADRAAGKLAAGDAAPLERALRAEAAELLHRLDDAEAAIDAAELALGIRPDTPAPPAPPAETARRPAAGQPSDDDAPGPGDTLR